MAMRILFPKKKAMFFTIAAVALLLALSLVISLQAKYKPKDMIVLETRISTMDDFVRNVNSDLQRGLYISSFRAVLSMEDFVLSNGSFLDSSENAFRELVLNGTLYNSQVSLMRDSTMVEWAERIQSKAADIGLFANISIDGISLSNSDSWTLLVESNVTINVTDSLDSASWRINRSVRSSISIIGLEDPVFSLNTQGRVVRLINSSPFEGNYVSGSNASGLLAHIDGKYYANSTGPSFLMRLEGNYSNSSFGIESFVNVPELMHAGISEQEKSMVDYVYFGNLSTGSIYSVNGTYNWFILDDAHLEKYQATSLSQP